MIHNVAVEGKEIQRVVFDRLIPAIEGEQFEVQLLSLLTLCVFMIKPNIDFDQLQQIVLSTSEYLMMQTSGNETIN